ncbi:hypothetical protein [Nocardia sp. NPDC051463]|uniref:hypothetical protein n=1 Tax=Nocardia sp. NPDC051463 TaxID=3154845 RepID=UPI003437DCE0
MPIPLFGDRVIPPPEVTIVGFGTAAERPCADGVDLSAAMADHRPRQQGVYPLLSCSAAAHPGIGYSRGSGAAPDPRRGEGKQ